MYYDLLILIPAGLILLRGDSRLSQLASLKPAGLIGWISISIYMLIFLNAPFHAEFPLVLTLIFLILFVVLLRGVDKICTTAGQV